MKPRKTKTQRATRVAAESIELRSPRAHGDAYDDVQGREETLAATSSTHQGPTDRRAEEPSDAAVPVVPIDEP